MKLAHQEDFAVGQDRGRPAGAAVADILMAGGLPRINDRDAGYVSLEKPDRKDLLPLLFQNVGEEIAVMQRLQLARLNSMQRGRG